MQLSLGFESFDCSFPASFDLESLDTFYHSFETSCSSAQRSLSFFPDEDEDQSWKTAKQMFTTDVFELRRGSDAFYVVGAAFLPPKPFWVARADFSLHHFSVSKFDYGIEMPDEQIINPALRILLRLSLMHNHFENSSGLLLHTAAAIINERMYLFPGCSGAGKSTFSRLFLNQADASLVNDDRMIVTLDDCNNRNWTAWGTPWPGELEIALNHNAPLGGLMFLEKSEQNSIEQLSPKEALTRLFSVASIPWYDEELVPKALDLCGRLVDEVPAYTLHFRPDKSAVAAVMDLLG